MGLMPWSSPRNRLWLTIWRTKFKIFARKSAKKSQFSTLDWPAHEWERVSGLEKRES